MIAIATFPPPAFSLMIFISMLAVFLGSGTVFFYLSHRWTSNRQRASLEDWAHEHLFELRLPPGITLPPAIQSLSSVNAQVEVCLVRASLTLLRIATTSKAPNPPMHWNILIRDTRIARVPAGLRPRGDRPSFLDLFSLTDFPSVSPSDRFMICAADSRSAREFAKSSLRGLLPADIGLILHGPYATLDFSNRPFDTIEFERMLVVMDQLLEHLPVPKTSR